MVEHDGAVDRQQVDRGAGELASAGEGMAVEEVGQLRSLPGLEHGDRLAPVARLLLQATDLLLVEPADGAARG